MKFERSSGILLHPTSLPSPYGIGDLGPQAPRVVNSGRCCRSDQLVMEIRLINVFRPLRAILI